MLVGRKSNEEGSDGQTVRGGGRLTTYADCRDGVAFGNKVRFRFRRV